MDEAGKKMEHAMLVFLLSPRAGSLWQHAMPRISSAVCISCPGRLDALRGGGLYPAVNGQSSLRGRQRGELGAFGLTCCLWTLRTIAAVMASRGRRIQDAAPCEVIELLPPKQCSFACESSQTRRPLPAPLKATCSGSLADPRVTLAGVVVQCPPPRPLRSGHARRRALFAILAQGGRRGRPSLPPIPTGSHQWLPVAVWWLPDGGRAR